MKETPITFPYVIAIIGFLLVIIASVKSFKSNDDTLTTSEKSPNSVTCGFVKFVKSFPDE